MKKNVLSLFDGMSCCQIALHRSGIRNIMYYASEVERPPIRVTQYHFPNTVQLGDIRNINPNIVPPIWLLTAGSPCQSFSMAGSKVGMVTSKNVEVTSLNQYLKLKSQNFKFKGQSYLFWEFVRLLKEMKPKYFLLENVKMDKKWEDLITRTLGVAPVRINSALVSAQNRERLYWTNIPNVVPPKDLGVHIRRVIPNAVGGAGIRGRLNKKKGTYDYCTTIRKDGKSNCLVTAWDRTGKVALKNGKIRILTIKEGEKLQTLPKDYTNVPKVSNTSRIEMIGNGWTIDVISHIFKNLKENI